MEYIEARRSRTDGTWNWWVLQTGNGKVDKLGGWGYIDENGAFRRLGNIPKRRTDRQERS